MKIKNLFAIAALLMASTSAFATTQDYTYEGIVYVLDDATNFAEVKKVSDDATYKAQTTWVIPEKFTALAANGAQAAFANKEFTVKTVAANAFAGNTVITSVTFAKAANITTIGAAAFKGCTALASFAIGDNVATIGAEAFSGCTAMATLTLGKANNNLTIGKEFIKGTAITTIDFTTMNGKTLTLGGMSAAVPAVLNLTGTSYDNASAVETAGKTVGTAVGNYAVHTDGKYYEITTAAIPAALEGNVFESTSLQSVIFTSLKTDGSVDKTVKVDYNDGTAHTDELPVEAFKNCMGLTSVMLPAALKAIPANIFKYTVLESLDMSYLSKLMTVGNMFGASEGAPYASLTSIKLPTTLPNNGTDANLTFQASAFAYCTGLTEITIPVKWAPTYNVVFAAGSFTGATGITTITFNPELTAGAWAGTKAIFHANAFQTTATPVAINFSTIKAYVDVATTAPNRTVYVYDLYEKKEITLTGKYALLKQTKAYRVKFEDGVVYQVYDDPTASGGDGTIYMVPFKVVGGYALVEPGYPVLVKAKKTNANGKLEIYVDETITAGNGSAWAASDLLRSSDTDVTALIDVAGYTPGTNYVNVAAITAGGEFGFGAPSANYLEAKTYYVISEKQYGAGSAARIVWLDEENTTAIQKVVNKSESNGEIFNLQGVRVNGTQKGVYIKNGKKFIVK